MASLLEHFEKPSVRYPLLSFAAALAFSTSLTTLPLLAACGASLGIAIMVSMGVRIGQYLKEIGDEAKGTFTEIRQTVATVKESTNKITTESNLKNVDQILLNVSTSVKALENTLKEFTLTAKALTDNLAFDEKKGEKPLTRQVNKTLVNLDATIKKVNAQLEEGSEDGTPTLLQTAKKTIEQVNKTVGDVDSALDQARQGKVGWALGMSKAPTAKKAPPAKASAEVEKEAEPVGVEQTPGWFSNPLNAAYWRKSQAAGTDKDSTIRAAPPAPKKTVQTRSKRLAK